MPFVTTASTTLPAAELDEVAATLRGFGFHDHAVDEQHRTMTRPGNRFAVRGHQRPLTVDLHADRDGVVLELRYDQWLAIDTGDLTRHVERIAAAVGR